MSGQQLGTVIGGAVGAFFGPAGAQIGMAVGGLVGGIVDPTKIDGPRIGDGQQQSSTDGAPIAWVMGTATVAGTIVQVGKRRDVKIKDSGKGGPTVTHHEARQDFAVLVCESSELRGSTVSSTVMVEQDGKIVYDVRGGSAMLADSMKWKAGVDFLYGAEDQLPHPTLEAITGIGNTPSYRGSCVAVFKDFNVTEAGGRIPSFQFTVSSSATESVFVQTKVASAGYAGGGRISYLLSQPMYVVPGVSMPDIVECSVSIVAQGPENISRSVLRASAAGAILWDSGWVGAADVAASLTGYLADNPGAAGGIDDLYTGLVSIPKDIKVTLYKSTMVVDLYQYASGGSATGSSFLMRTVPPTPTQTLETLTLADIVTRICVRGGLQTSDIDVIDLAGIDVTGYPIARQANAADALAPLLQAYFCYASEYDGQIHFKRYGANAVMTIDDADLLEANDANDNHVTSDTRNQATEFPRKITATYMDPAQNYMPVTVAAERLAIDVKAIGEQTLSIPVVMPADQAKQAVEKALKVAYATLEGKQEYSVPFAGKGGAYLSICAGEPIIFRGKRWVVDENVLGNGYVKLSTRYDRQSAYTSNVQAIVGNAPTLPQSPYSGPTQLVAMNLPSLRPQDTYGLYLAASARDGQDSWRGCTVQVSYDGQITWQNVEQIVHGATMGTLTLDEPVGGEPLTVLVNGDLLTITDAQIAAQGNAFAIKHAAGDEVGQFKTTAEVGTDEGGYELTDVSRGLLGTTRVAGIAGDLFVMLDSVYFLPIDLSFSGQTIYLRAVGFGEVAEDSQIVSVVYQPDTTVIINGGGD